MPTRFRPAEYPRLAICRQNASQIPLKCLRTAEVRCWLGELSQQPTCPQLAHLRRCSHHPGAAPAKHSTQPVPLDGTSVLISACISATSVSLVVFCEGPPTCADLHLDRIRSAWVGSDRPGASVAKGAGGRERVLHVLEVGDSLVFDLCEHHEGRFGRLVQPHRSQGEAAEDRDLAVLLDRFLDLERVVPPVRANALVCR